MSDMSKHSSLHFILEQTKGTTNFTGSSSLQIPMHIVCCSQHCLFLPLERQCYLKQRTPNVRQLYTQNCYYCTRRHSHNNSVSVPFAQQNQHGEHTAPGICWTTDKLRMWCWSHLWRNTCSKRGATAPRVLQRWLGNPEGCPTPQQRAFYDSLAPRARLAPPSARTAGDHVLLRSMNDVSSEPTTVAGLLTLGNLTTEIKIDLVNKYPQQTPRVQLFYTDTVYRCLRPDSLQ